MLNLIYLRRLHDKLVHISDWLPTIMSLAQIDVPEIEKLDGVNQATAIFDGNENSTPRYFGKLGFIRRPLQAFCRF